MFSRWASDSNEFTIIGDSLRKALKELIMGVPSELNYIIFIPTDISKTKQKKGRRSALKGGLT